MRTAGLLLLFVIASNSAIAQDLIVTNEKDSIHCYIYKQKKELLYYSVLENEKEIKKTIPMDSVLSMIYDYEHVKNYPVMRQKPGHTDLKEGPELPREFYLSLSGGVSRRIGAVSENLPGTLQDYVKELITGYHVNVDAAYFSFGHSGFGVKYSLFNTKNMGYWGEPPYIDKLSDNITVYYIGPAYYLRYYTPNGKFSIGPALSLGFFRYKDVAYFFDDFTVTGQTFGVEGDLGLDYYLSKHFAVGAKISGYYGKLGKAMIDYGWRASTVELTQPESLMRLDFSLGVRKLF